MLEMLSNLCKAVEVVRSREGPRAPDFGFFAFWVGLYRFSKKRKVYGLSDWPKANRLIGSLWFP